ncbi:MAG: SH3 domain-containing protein [Desulfopila sp.]
MNLSNNGFAKGYGQGVFRKSALERRLSVRTILSRIFSHHFFNYLILFLFFFFIGVSVSAAQVLSVKSNNVNLRAKPGLSAQIKWQYSYGFPVKVLQRKGDWVHVTDFEKDTGWIYASLLSTKQFVIVKVHRNSNSKINIRKGPSTKTSVVGQAYYGVVFEVIGKKGSWLNVRHESGLKGWVSGSLVWGQ